MADLRPAPPPPWLTVTPAPLGVDLYAVEATTDATPEQRALLARTIAEVCGRHPDSVLLRLGLCTRAQAQSVKVRLGVGPC